MQNILFISVIVEALILILLAAFKRLTKKAFYFITVFVMICCGLGVGVFNYNKKVEKAVDQRAYIYMTVALVEDGHDKEALSSLGQLVEIEDLDEDVKLLRGLVYNANASFISSVKSLESLDTDQAKSVSDASKAEEYVDEDTKAEICETILDHVDASDKEMTLWDAQMKVQYLDIAIADNVDDQDEMDFSAFALAKDELLADRYGKAFEIIEEEASYNVIQADVLLAEMYAGDYNQRTIRDGDQEYMEKWKEISKKEAELNLLSIKVNEAKENGSDDYEELQEEFDLLFASNRNAYDQFEMEGIKRAINYLDSLDYGKKDFGYNLEMAYLYFRCHDNEATDSYLEKIFNPEDFSEDMWMKDEISMLKQSFVAYLSTGNKSEFDTIFGESMNSLYQNIYGYYNSHFQDYVENYLKETFGAFYVTNVDASNFPEITAVVALNDTELKLDEMSLELFDTKTKIEKFTVAEKEISQMNVCFVIDRSGSMQGDRMKDCKDAVSDSIDTLPEGTKIGLVSFESTATIDNPLTTARTAIKTKVASLNASGGTSIASGLELACDVLQGANGERVVILLSDGYDGDTGSGRLDSAITKLISNGITVYSIGLDGCDENYMRSIAEKTGGYFRYVSDSRDLSDVYKNIQSSIFNTYVISYTVATEEELRDVELRAVDTQNQAYRNYQKNAAQVEVSSPTQSDDKQKSDLYKQNGGD